jgi:TrmH family RNA methyltransferase
VIESTANPRVKAWLRLRDRRERDSTGLTLVDGVREVGRALDAGADVVEAIVGPALAAREDGRTMLTRLGAIGVPVVEVSEPVLARLAFGDRSDGVVAVVGIPELSLEALALEDSPLVVVLEGVEKPGNLGAVLRSADGAGADAVIAADPRTDLFNPNAIRASLGTIFSIPIAAASGPEVLGWCRQRGLKIVAARVDSASSYTDVDLRGGVSLVLGSEATGLTPVWDVPDVVATRIPMLGVADSLNVAAAAAVLLYEARRQRGLQGG